MKLSQFSFLTLLILFVCTLRTLPAQELAPDQVYAHLRAGDSYRFVGDVPYKTTPQGELHLDFYYPKKEPSAAYPVVVYTHGGGWAAGSKKAATAGGKKRVLSALTEKGICVVAVQYRLVEKDGETAMHDCVIDAKDAIRYLAKNADALRIDPDRVMTFGDSAGGHLAQMLLLSAPDVLEGAKELAGNGYKTIGGVSWYGPCDFENEQLFNYDDNPKFRDRFGARILLRDSKPEDKLSLYREMSPVNYLTKESPPLLMIQGDGDTTIPVKHAYYMQKKAMSIGAPVEILIIAHAGHNWREADGKTEIQPGADVIVQRTVDFLAKCAGE